MLSTGQLVTEEFYALGKLVRLGMGLHHYDGNTTLCMASAVSGYKLSFGTDGPPGSYEDFELADVVVLWGANIADNHPLLAPRMLGRGQRDHRRRPPRDEDGDGRRRAPAGAAPRRRRPAQRHPHRALRRGAGRPRRVGGPRRGHRRARRRTSQAWTVERAAAESGIDAATIRETARTIAAAERCVLAWTMGVNHSVQGTDTVTLLNTLAVLTGNIGKPGRVAVLDHRAVQRDGHPGDRLHGVDARLPRLRRPGPPCRAGRAVGRRRGPPPGRARPCLPGHHQRRRQRADQGAVGHRHEPGRVVPEPRGARVRPRARSTCSSSRTGSRRRPPTSPTSSCPPPCGARRTGR